MASRRNRLLTHYAFNILDFEDCPKIITETNHLRSQALDLNGLRHAKGSIILRLQAEAELAKEIELDFNVSHGTPQPEVKRALLTLYKENRVLRENILDLDIIQAQKNSIKFTTNVCYKILEPLEDIATDETETEELPATLKNIIERLTSEKEDLERRKKRISTELKKRQDTVRLLEKRVAKTAVVQETVMKAALENLKKGQDLNESEMLLVALHRWKNLNFRLRDALYANYLRFVDMFKKMRTQEDGIFQELLIAPPLLYEARNSVYKEKTGTSLPATPNESKFDVICERSKFPFLLAHLSLRAAKLARTWEDNVYIKTTFRDAGTILKFRQQ